MLHRILAAKPGDLTPLAIGLMLLFSAVALVGCIWLQQYLVKKSDVWLDAWAR